MRGKHHIRCDTRHPSVHVEALSTPATRRQRKVRLRDRHALHGVAFTSEKLREEGPHVSLVIRDGFNVDELPSQFDCANGHVYVQHNPARPSTESHRWRACSAAPYGE